MRFKIIPAALVILLFSAEAWSQGCVAIRHFSTCSPTYGQTNPSVRGDFQVGMNYRYFKSFRHFRGTEEEPDRVTNNTEVVNHSHSFDYFISYGISDRWQVALNVPFVLNSRSSLYEHGRSERYSTFSRGMGDITINTNYWLIDPFRNSNFNIQAGAGIKLPTGNYNASDIFYNVGPNETPETRPVDQSIQPGDGGFGFTLQGQGYYLLNEKFSLFAAGFYLFNPRNTNGIRTFRETLSPILSNEAIMSVTDQFSVQGGFSYMAGTQLSLQAGVRYEGIPVQDVIGDSEGFRRPGNVLSVEPGINYTAGNWNLMLSVPVAVRRERPQSLTDKEIENETGNPRNGDAAFADYLINVGISLRLPGKSKIDI